MTYEEIKKYARYIRYLAKLKANMYVEADDLISAAYEKLCRVKIRKENAYKHYINCMIRHAIIKEIKKHKPNPYRNNHKKQYPLMPEHQKFLESETPPEGTQENYIDKIYFKEKLEEILKVSTKQEKQYIQLFLQDLNPLEIAKKMKIDHRYISEIVKKIRNKTRRNDPIW